MDYRSLNPATGDLVETYPFASAAEVAATLRKSERAAAEWRQSSHADRRSLLEAVANLLEKRSVPLAEMMALEMGKPLAQGRSEAEKCAWVCRYYAEVAEEMLQSLPVDSDGSESWIRFDPLGSILAIMPWNFPLWQVFRFLAPAIAVGNVGILKHAPSTPQCALAMVDILGEAGAPEGLFQSLFLSNEQAAEVMAHPTIRGVTLTGSTGAGREVGAHAARALKPLVLELGGSDPFIVFADADLERAAEVGVASRCLNSGQSCIAAKRFLVVDEVYDEFLESLVSRMQSQKVGSPTEEGVDIGPLAREDLRQHVVDQVTAAQSAGGRLACGGSRIEGPGFFYPPTVVTDLEPSSEAAKEEIFGPVASVYRFRGETDAVALANDTDFGLGASLWTADRQRIDRLVPRLEVGSVFVNGLVKSDPRLPFGGTKDSGLGRELGREGLLEFVNTKTVWIG